MIARTNEGGPTRCPQCESLDLTRVHEADGLTAWVCRFGHHFKWMPGRVVTDARMRWESPAYQVDVGTEDDIMDAEVVEE